MTTVALGGGCRRPSQKDTVLFLLFEYGLQELAYEFLSTLGWELNGRFQGEAN